MHHPSDHPTATILIGHGTRNPDGTSQFIDMVTAINQRQPDQTYYAAFMELCEPDIAATVAQAVADGHHHILCQPVLLLAAGHAKNDLPAMINEIQNDHPHTVIDYGTPLGLSSELVSMCANHIKDHTTGTDRSASTLLVVGRGTSDPDANSDVSKLARMLEEGLGFAESSVCYFSTTTPTLDTGLSRTASRTPGTVVLFPFLMFSGMLSNAADHHLELMRSQHPDTSWIVTPPFGTTPHFASTVEQHIHNALDPNLLMPCRSCKYRSKLPGHEHEEGIPQPSGHHHHHHHSHGH